MQVSEWCALEQGWVPGGLATLRAIAGALEVDWKDYHMLAILAESHRKRRQGTGCVLGEARQLCSARKS
ncbi:MAG: hypothetical protein CXZ00_16765 [Acidobacteria bacterium]|nr:MAG: hypothetical protein CXZ00_16765 [Acidobacteriota bacterium]